MKNVAISYGINLFSPKDNVNNFAELPPEFSESFALFKEEKKKSLPTISALIGDMIKVKFKAKKNKILFEIFQIDPDYVTENTSLTIENAKWFKNKCIPCVTIDAVLQVPITEKFSLLYENDNQLMRWQSKNGLLANAIEVSWEINFWGTEGKDLNCGEYHSSRFMFEGI